MKRGLVERAKQSLPQSLKPQHPVISNGDIHTTDQSLLSSNNIASDVIASASPSESSILPPSKVPRVNRLTIKSESSNTIPEKFSSPYDRSPRPPPESPRVSKSTENNSILPSRKSLSNGETAHGRKTSSSTGRTASSGVKSSGHFSNNNDNNDNDDEQEDKASAFFLRHQNRALATELKSLQHSVSSLTKERDIRRQECYDCVQALNSLNATWVSLESALCGSPSIKPSNGLPAPVLGGEQTSTGDGASVEWSRAIQLALGALGKTRLDSEIKSESKQKPLHRKRKLQYIEDSDIGTDDCNGEDGGSMRLDISANIAARAQALKDVIWQRITAEIGVDGNTSNAKKIIAELERTNSLLEAEKQTLEVQIAELVASRNDTAGRERRIRRNVYRLAAGMLTSDQVVKSTETDEDIAAEVETDKQNRVQLEQLQKENEHLQSLVSDGSNHSDSVDGVHGTFQSTISQGHADALLKQIADLQDEVTSLKSALSELNEIIKKKEQRITELTLNQLTDKHHELLKSAESNSQKLKASSEMVKELEITLEKTRNNWSKAVANEKAACATIDEMTIKFNKRWAELTGDSMSDHASKEGDDEGMLKIKEQALEIVELQHKLDQALENVRQAESTRNSLKEALLLNGSIQSKLDEIKAKYAAVQAQRNTLVAGNRGSSVVNPVTTTSSQNNKEKAADQSSISNARGKDTAGVALPDKDSTANSVNKMDKIYRKARKDLAALKESKEIVKGKLDRSEKERESLGEANARLLKQIAEKDDVNAKSLSTILYLKGQTDVLLAEKHLLEQQTKTAGQLALAARLATNAKDRFADEVAKEKRSLELRIEVLESEKKELILDQTRLASQLAELQGKASAEDSELQNARSRISELVEECAEQRERTSDLESAFSKANREAREAKSKLQSQMDNISAANNAPSTAISSMRVAAGGSEFTVEQLTTQISVLKSRLACPVCHERDKQCIIMRCRHMHCQQCVDDQISNRSRKCPTCNNKFSEKDVEDIWLNT